MLDLNAVDVGFSRKAEIYDAYCENHPVIRWARGMIRQEVIRRLSSGASILELNAGTGSDAAHFVEQGYRVHATDLANGMITAIQNKINNLNESERFTVQQISFTELNQVKGKPYDVIFSNFGGLNCIPDLNSVTKSLNQLLKPGGYIVFVVMPPICPWELAQILRGKFEVATRRLHLNGVLANVEGARVMTLYHSPRKVMKAFSPNYRLLHQQSLSLFCPPSYMDRFPRRFPRFAQVLMQWDEALGMHRPFCNWGDFVMYTFHYGS